MSSSKVSLRTNRRARAVQVFKRIAVAAVLIAAMAMLLACSGAATVATKKDGAKKAKGRATGAITAINTTAKTISIQAGQTTPVTLTVSATTKLLRNRKKATLADLVVGDSAKASYDSQTMQLTRLNATPH